MATTTSISPSKSSETEKRVSERVITAVVATNSSLKLGAVRRALERALRDLSIVTSPLTPFTPLSSSSLPASTLPAVSSSVSTLKSNEVASSLSGFICTSCTFANEVMRPYCDVCGAARPRPASSSSETSTAATAAVPTRKSDTKTIDKKEPTLGRAEASSLATPGVRYVSGRPWSCTICTAVNKPQSLLCLSCFRPRDDKALAIDDTHHHDDDHSDIDNDEGDISSDDGRGYSRPEDGDDDDDNTPPPWVRALDAKNAAAAAALAGSSASTASSSSSVTSGDNHNAHGHGHRVPSAVYEAVIRAAHADAKADTTTPSIQVASSAKVSSPSPSIGGISSIKWHVNVTGCEAKSQVSEQPVGDDETLRGMHNRHQHAKYLTKSNQVTIHFPTCHMMCNVCML
jgi:hypothetical protein